MSLRRIATDLKSRDLHDVQVLEYAKVLLSDFQKSTSVSAEVLELLCAEYPKILSRTLMGHTIFSLLQDLIAKAESIDCLGILSTAVCSSRELAKFEQEQINWLLGLIQAVTMVDAATSALEKLSPSPFIQQKVRKLRNNRQTGGVPLPDQFRYSTSIETVPNDRLLAELPAMLEYVPVQSPKRLLMPSWRDRLESLLGTQEFVEDADLRIAAVETLDAVFCVYKPGFELSHDCLLGSWIIGCIRSTNHFLRLRSLRLLLHFISDEMPTETLSLLLKSLKLVIVGGAMDPHYETVLTAWAIGACACEGEHLNFFLLKIIGELSSTNFVKTSLAFQQLRFVVAHKRLTAYQLFMPFWKTVALILVLKSDDIIAQFCDFCSISVSVFLSRTAKTTLPSLVMFGKTETIEKIAAAETLSVEKLLDKYFAPIMALLITSSPTPEEYVDRTLKQISRRVAGLSARTMSGNKPARLILAELLKLSTSCEHDKIVAGVRFLYPQGLDKDVVFNLMAVYTQDLCFNKSGRLFPLGRAQYLRGLQLLIESKLANLYIVRTQLFTLLQSQIKDPLTAFYSLKVWHAMLVQLADLANSNDEDEVEQYFDLTLAIISYNWAAFGDSAKDQARVIWSQMLANPWFKLAVASRGFISLPEPAWNKKFEAAEAAERPVRAYQQFQNMIGRCRQENFYIVYQSVADLSSFIAEHQEVVSFLLADEDDCHDLEEAMQVLIGVSKKFKDQQLQILCSECLGHLGAIDPHRVDITPPVQFGPVVVESFGTFEESCSFVAHIIRYYLVPELESTPDPDIQMYLGYEIQELLKFCGFTADTLSVKKKLSKLTSLFGGADSIVPLVSPFLWTKYKLSGNTSSSTSSTVYPIYPQDGSGTYSDWLKSFTFDIMCRADGANAGIIFGHLSKLFSKDREQFHFERIALFALPYAVLNALLYKPEAKALILDELNRMLQLKVDAQTSLIHKCIFSILDYLGLWIREKKLTGFVKEIAVVESLRQGISPELMGWRAFEGKNYPRAIRYWEQELKSGRLKSTESIEGMLNLFREMYDNLDDIDSIIGISKLQDVVQPGRPIEIDEMIQQYSKTQQWDSALAAYNAFSGELGEWDTKRLGGLLECYRSSGHPELALSRINFIPNNLIDQEMSDLAVESAWRAQSWSAFEDWCKVDTRSLAQSVAHSIRAVTSGADNQGSTNDFDSSIAQAKLLAMGEIAGQEVTSLSQIRRQTVYLHAITDLGTILGQRHRDEANACRELNAHLSKRLERIGNDFKSRDYLLTLHRVFYQQVFQPETEFTKLKYIQAAKEARKCGNYGKALEYVLTATRLEHPLATQEYAKLLWSQGDQTKAIDILKTSVNKLRPRRAAGSQPPSLYAKQALLHTRWLDASGYSSSEAIVERYYELMQMHKQWDKVYYRLAKHWLKIHEYQSGLEPSQRSLAYYNGDLFCRIVEPLFKTLKYGAKYVEEVLPKFLTLWLDFTANVQSEAFKHEVAHLGNRKTYTLIDERMSAVQTVNSMLRRNLEQKDRVPAYFFYNSLPQLMSRITTAEEDIFALIKTIVLLVCKVYPEQGIWALIESRNSSIVARKARGNRIIDELVATRPAEINSALNAIHEFVKLCSLDLRKEKGVTKASLSTLSFNRKRVDGTMLAIPTQKNLQCILPEPGIKLSRHVAFKNTVRFSRVYDQVDIMTSLQRPKKVSVEGTDGKIYHILCKNLDDVRKDARLMDFTTTINHLLNRDNMAMSRHLQIISYKVVPLMDQGGLIEWVDGAIPTRKIIKELHAAQNITWNFSKISGCLDANLAVAQRKKNFIAIQKELPAVLPEYFINRFPDPMSWLRARNLYARSTAVMSIVGYILGLGDRHLENLLIVENTGGVLHVDFDCLFDKGATFHIPEVVPFRLTKNMIRAFGVHKYEGAFRKCCEITLALLHKNRSLLMTILEPFVYDPVVSNDSQRQTGLTPTKSLERIKRKLELHKVPALKSQASTSSAPMSAQGLVEELISAAIDPEKLCQMYIGWCAFL